MNSSRARTLRVCRWLFLGLVLVAACVVAIGRGLEQASGGDFNVFWSAGGRFWSGLDLYAQAPDDRNFIYPPFAAFVFQVLHLLPLVPSAVVFGLVNVALMVVVYWLVDALLTRAMPVRRRGQGPLVAGLILAHSYLLNNMNLVQVNVIILLLVLWGVKLALDQREAWAAAVFLIAAAIKVMPVLFLVWLLIRRPRGAVIGTGIAALIVIALPLLQRGPERGVRDLQEYYQTFLEDFTNGRVVADYTNQNLASAIERMSRPVRHRERLDYRWLPLSERTSALVRNLVTLTILGVLGMSWLVLRRKNLPMSVYEVSAVFLAWHLVSGITWKSHLVSFLFVFTVFVATPLAGLRTGPRRLMRAALALILVTSFIGRDIVGRTAHYYIGGWSFLTWMMLLMFGLAAWFSVAQPWESRAPTQTPAHS